MLRSGDRRSAGSRVAAGLLAFCLGQSAAEAAEHFVEISEAYSSDDGSVQYVILRMEIPFQNVVAGNDVTVQDSTGSGLPPLPNGQRLKNGTLTPELARTAFASHHRAAAASRRWRCRW